MASHRSVIGAALAASFFLALSATTASAAALTCLTGTSPVVASDAGDVADARAAIAAACPCSFYDGSASGRKHGDYVRCAKGIIDARADEDDLRTQCKGTVKKFYSISTCGYTAAQNKTSCVKTTGSGKVSCAIKPALLCLTTPAASQVACPSHAHCIDAADTNATLVIGDGDSGSCAPPPSTPTPTPVPTPTPTPAPSAGFQAVLSHAVDPSDLKSSFELPDPKVSSTTTFNSSQMDISGVAGVTVSASYAVNGDLTLINKSWWGGIRNATVSDTATRGIDIRNFMNADVTLGAGDDDVVVTGAKRGTIATNDGDDTITISGNSNNTENNLMTVRAGAGDDVVTFNAGNLSRAMIDGGDGADQLTVSGKAAATIIGGAGNDRLVDNSTGLVTLTGGTGNDVFEIKAGAIATITDFALGQDKLHLVGVAPAAVNATVSGGSTIVTLGGGATVTLLGVSLTEAQIDPFYS